MYTLKVNIRAQEAREKREKERQVSEAILKIQSGADGPAARPRKRRGLNFHQPGTFIAQGEQLRKKARVEALQKKIAERAAKTGIATAAKLASLTTTVPTKTSGIKPDPATFFKSDEEVPNIEWWDKPILGRQVLDDIVPKLAQKTVEPSAIFIGITNLVEHPPLKKPPGPDLSDIQAPIFLTQKERKKLRRQNRKKQELEKQEKIKLGLLPKPEPKLKRSNLMYALGDEAITNPSLAERMVKEQEEKRLQAHIEHNESKKLTLEGKKAKKLRKVQEDLNATGTWVAIYRVHNLTVPAHRPKMISQNAKQLTMTGTIVLFKDINLVIVEGGPKQQRKFKHLMLDRLKWTEDPLDNSQLAIDETPTTNRTNLTYCCQVVWEGQVTKRAFSYIKIKQFEQEQEVRKYFRDFNVENYWDLAFKMSILESIEDT